MAQGMVVVTTKAVGMESGHMTHSVQSQDCGANPLARSMLQRQICIVSLANAASES